MKRFYSFLEKLQEQVRWQSYTIMGLLVVVLIEGIFLFRLATHKTIIVLPPRVDKEFWVSGEELSYSYLEQTGKYLADRILNVSPAMVDKSVASVYPFLTTNPDELKAIKEVFASYTNSIKNNDWWQSFYPMKVIVDPQNQILAVEGILKKFTSNTYIGEERRTIVFKFTVQQGRFIVREVKL